MQVSYFWSTKNLLEKYVGIWLISVNRRTTTFVITYLEIALSNQLIKAKEV